MGVDRRARLLVRLAAIAPVLASLTVVGSVTKLAPSIAGCAQASTAHHAALVVEHGDGSVIRICVTFSQPSITGDQLLSYAHTQAQLEYATTGYGGSNGDAVCQIDYEPAQFPPGCWTASSPYWAIFVSRGGGSWTDSSLGISSQTFGDGDAQGFRYEAQSDRSTPASPSGVCPVTISSAPAPTRSAVPAPPRKTGTSTSAPTAATSAAAGTASAARVNPTAPPFAVSSASPTPRAAGVIISRNRSAPLQSGGTATWVAVALGGLLLVGLVAQLARRRPSSGRRPQP